METEIILNELNIKQREICSSDDSFYVIASPGSGKTRLLTHRLAFFSEKYKDSCKWNIAITYTNRAAEEIENRLSEMGVSSENVWTGTIHQFCLAFIIRPYAMYSKRLCKGYRIIDEFVSRMYGMDIAKELGITISYYENPLNNQAIYTKYRTRLEKNREIDFDMILEYSKELLTSNKFICENIANTVRLIQVDEFQDTNEIQYEIISEIVKQNRKINLLFVGDINQAIFGNLGGCAKSKKEIEEMIGVELKEETLNGCYRSSQRIIDYYRNFEVVNTGTYSLSSENKDVRGEIMYSDENNKNQLLNLIVEIIQKNLEQGIEENNICIVAPQWQFLYPISKQLQERLPGINFDSPEITPFKYNPLNPFYLFARLIYTSKGEKTNIRKRIATDILNIIINDYKICIDSNIDKFTILKYINGFSNSKLDGIDFYIACVEYVLSKLGIDLELELELQETYQQFIEKARDRIKRFSLIDTNDGIRAYLREKKGIVISTIHGVKGEEYDSVIAFSLLNGYLPHWEYIRDYEKKRIREVETNKLLYVLCSRTRKNLYLFSEKGRVTGSGNAYTPTDELKRVSFDYDRIEFKMTEGNVI